MPLTQEQREKIRRFVYEHAVPQAKVILEAGGFVPDEMEDEEAFAEVESVLREVRTELLGWSTTRTTEPMRNLGYSDPKDETREKRVPKQCPACGSTELHREVTDWFAHSLDSHDLHNTAVVTESQCDGCGLAFWT